MVSLARLSRGLTQAELAKALGVQQGTVSRIEAGALTVSHEDLESLSRVLDYPASFFSQHEPLDGPGVAELYHTRKRKTVRAIALHRAYATTTIKRLHVETLLRSAEKPDAIAFPLFPSDEFGDAEQVARTVRAQLEIPPGPIHNMTSTIEEAGGIVITCDFETRLIDAFTRWRQPTNPPLFFINRELPPDRWRWTLAHELGHAVMHTNQYPSERMEDEANAFANEFLMPRQLIRHQLLNADLKKLAGLKTYWKVSMQALIMRGHDLDLITSRQKSYMFMQLNRAGYKLREPEDLDPPVEPPDALFRLIQHHLRRLRYTVAELAQTLHLFEHELIAQYLPGQTSLRLVKAN
jgi:Zn-dependent peptidase ImmA (M78 family)/DNA-binding XRE family transcriptional regulator